MESELIKSFSTILNKDLTNFRFKKHSWPFYLGKKSYSNILYDIMNGKPVTLFADIKKRYNGKEAKFVLSNCRMNSRMFLKFTLLSMRNKKLFPAMNELRQEKEKKRI